MALGAGNASILVDVNGTPLGTAGNPLVTSGGGGSTAPATLIESATSAVAGAAVSATLTPPAGKTAIVYGFILTYSNNVTSALTGLVTLSDGTWTLTFQFNETSSVNGNDFTPVTLWPGLLASAINTPITLSVPAMATGGSASISLWGGSQ